MAAIDRKGSWKPTKGTPIHFEELLERPCPNHSFPVEHLYKDYDLMKQFLSRGSNKEEHRKEPKPATDTAEGEGR